MTDPFDVGSTVTAFQLQPVTDALAPFVGEGLASTITAAGVFVVVVIAFYLLNRVTIKPLVDRVLDNRGLEPHARRPLKKLVSILVLFVGISVGFGLAGYGSFLQSLATIAAAATLAVGFALQDVIRNFVAGVFIYADRPFKIGDWIEWNDQAGIVEDISFRVTRVRTFDNELLTVPNATLTENVIKNPVAKETLRLKFIFGIDYDDDIQQAAEIIVEEAESHPEILEEPQPVMRIVELGDSHVGLQSRFWIDSPKRSDFVKIRSEYVQNVKERFDRDGITIPFPQRTLSGRGEWERLPGRKAERSGVLESGEAAD